MFKYFSGFILFSLILSGCSGDESIESTQSDNDFHDNEKKSVIVDESENNDNTIDLEEATDTPKLLSKSTGTEIESENNYHFSVMVENSPNSRPQSGLIDADIVYEIKTEGNITRYLALFNDELPKRIGPVRSSRHYFIPLSEDLNAPYVHFGASTYAYAYLQSGNLKVPHIDGIYQSKYFARDDSKKAPHNAYVYPDKLPTYDDIELKNEMLSFGDVSDSSNIVTDIMIQYNSFTKVNYVYNSINNNYGRFQEDIEHIDEDTDEQIHADNVLLLYATHSAIKNDNLGRIDVELYGEGAITLLTNGKRFDGIWKREKGNSFSFYDSNGDTFYLNPGKTWIQIVDKNIPIELN